jgi:hypothetical protein
LTEDWGLRMVETTCKEQFIETGNKMDEVPVRLLKRIKYVQLSRFNTRT